MPTAPNRASAAAATIDLNRSAVSRYIQLATLFRRRIEQGVWRTGEQIPTVDDLAAECGVARATIRQALDPRFRTLENVVLAPHSASITHETRAALIARILADIEAFCAGHAFLDAAAAAR